MAKEISGYIKLQIPAGQANPAPPVGPALGQHGVNIMEFCKAYNAATQDQAGLVIPVVITVYSDRSFSFETKSPPAAVLLKKAAGLAKGSGVPNRDKVGKVTRAQIEEIVETKKKDLISDMDAAVRIIEGTARSMGIEVINCETWKKYLSVTGKIDREANYELNSAISFGETPAKFDETIEFAFRRCRPVNRIKLYVQSHVTTWLRKRCSCYCICVW